MGEVDWAAIASSLPGMAFPLIAERSRKDETVPTFADVDSHGVLSPECGAGRVPICAGPAFRWRVGARYRCASRRVQLLAAQPISPRDEGRRLRAATGAGRVLERREAVFPSRPNGDSASRPFVAQWKAADASPANALGCGDGR